MNLVNLGYLSTDDRLKGNDNYIKSLRMLVLKISSRKIEFLVISPKKFLKRSLHFTQQLPLSTLYPFVPAPKSDKFNSTKFNTQNGRSTSFRNGPQ